MVNCNFRLIKPIEVPDSIENEEVPVCHLKKSTSKWSMEDKCDEESCILHKILEKDKKFGTFPGVERKGRA